jgi:hypothetical protein
MRKLILILLPLIFFLVGCRQSDEETKYSITITGHVYNPLDEGIGDVLVWIVGPSLSNRSETYSQADGYYELTHSWMWPSWTESKPSITLWFEKENYHSYKFIIENIVNGKTYNINGVLNPRF